MERTSQRNSSRINQSWSSCQLCYCVHWDSLWLNTASLISPRHRHWTLLGYECLVQWVCSTRHTAYQSTGLPDPAWLVSVWLWSSCECGHVRGERNEGVPEKRKWGDRRPLCPIVSCCNFPFFVNALSLSFPQSKWLIYLRASNVFPGSWTAFLQNSSG